MARMMDRMMVESLQPFGFARMTARRNGDQKGEDNQPRDGLRTERSEVRRERAKTKPPNTHAANGTRHLPTQGNTYNHYNNILLTAGLLISDSDCGAKCRGFDFHQ